MNKVLNTFCVFSYHMSLSFRLAVYIFTTLICQEKKGGGYFTVVLLLFFILLHLLSTQESHSFPIKTLPVSFYRLTYLVLVENTIISTIIHVETLGSGTF